MKKMINEIIKKVGGITERVGVYTGNLDETESRTSYSSASN